MTKGGMEDFYHLAELTFGDGTKQLKWLQTNRHRGTYSLYGFSERPTQQIKVFDVPGMMRRQGFIHEGVTFDSNYNRSHIQCMHPYGDDRTYWMADPVRDISLAYTDDWFKKPRGCWFS
jgi:hypothetical protein